MREYALLIRQIYSQLGPYKKSFCILAIIGALDAAVGFGIPWSIAKLIEAQGDQKTLFFVVLSLFMVSLCLQYSLRKFAESLGPEISFYLRSEMLRKASRVPLTKLQKLHTGYILSLTTSVADSTGSLVTSSLWGLVRVITVLILFFISVWNESPLIAVLNAGFLLIFVAISRYLASPVAELSKASNLARARALAVYADFIGQLRTLFRLELFSFAEKKVAIETKEAIRTVKRFQSFHAKRWFLLHSLYGGAFFTTLAFLLVGISQNKTSPAMLILFVGAFSQIKVNLEWMAENFVTVRNYLQITKDLNEAFNEETKTDRKIASNWDSIVFKCVEFNYEENSSAISIPGFEIKKKDWWIIKGASGEGKTTFLHILSGLYEPQKGEILIDGNREQRINAVLISQESELFSVSLRENLTLGNNEISDSRILELFSKVGLSAWLSELPEGLDTVVGERGQFLSAGQRQRLNLIRGILLNRDLYLLDEPATHLDEANRELLLRCIEEELAEKTVVIVSHQELELKAKTKLAEFKNHILALSPL